MRIENQTKWRSDHLRAFVRRVATDHLDANHRKELVVRFVNARTRGVSGFAFYGLVRYKGRLVRYTTIRLPTGNPRRPQRNGPSIKVYNAEGLWHWERCDGGPSGTVMHRTPGLLPDRRAIAAVLEHEFGHTLGRRHPGCHGASVMRGHYDSDELAKDRYAWADTLPLEKS